MPLRRACAARTAPLAGQRPVGAPYPEPYRRTNANHGRTVVVTGAAGGIGSALVDGFLANGDRVVATDAPEVLAALRHDPPQDTAITKYAADIVEASGVADFADAALAVNGRVDVLVNCAGYFPPVPFADLSAADFRQVVDVNLTGTFLVTKAFAPAMQRQGWERIVNYYSASVFVGVPNQAHYVAAKAGIIGFTRSIARELGRFGVTANCITPGITSTKAAVDKLPGALLEERTRSRAIPREQVATDLVGPTLFLASDAAAFVTGQTLNVDGGGSMA